MASTGSAVRPEDVRDWGQQLDEVARRIGARFPRSETRDRVRAYLVGLLGPVQRKNAWQVAEQIGDADPYGVQYLMGRSDWDPDAVRDDLRAYVVEALGDPDAVLILDETGFLKKGTKSAGVARQYTGTAGRIENAQVGVFLAYASRARHGVPRPGLVPARGVDRRPGAVRGGGHPRGDGLRHQAPAGQGDARAGVRGRGAGGVGHRRRGLRQRRRAAAVAGGARGGRTCWRSGPTSTSGSGFRQSTVAALAEALPKRAWHKITIAAGSKGPRRYAWAWVPINHDLGPRWRRWLLVRRSLDDPEELAYYIAAGPSRHDADPAGQDRRGAVVDRGRLRVGQAGGRAGRLRGAELDGLAPARHPVAAGPRRPGGGAEAGRRAAEKKSADEPELIRADGRRRSAGCWCGCCGAACRRPTRCWGGRSGGGPTRRSRGDATTRSAEPSRRISYNCSIKACGWSEGTGTHFFRELRKDGPARGIFTPAGLSRDRRGHFRARAKWNHDPSNALSVGRRGNFPAFSSGPGNAATPARRSAGPGPAGE